MAYTSNYTGAQIDQYLSQIPNIKNSINQTETNLISVEQNISDINLDISNNIKTTLSSLQKDIQNIKSLLDNSSTNTTNLQQQIEEISNEMDDLAIQINNKISNEQYSLKIKELQDEDKKNIEQMNSMGSSIREDLEGIIRTHSSDVKLLQDDISKLYSNNTSISNNIDSINTSLTSNENSIATLNLNLQSIQNSLSNYVLNNDLNNTLSNYVLNNNLNNTLNNYVLNDNLNSTLNNYVLNDNLNDTLSNYVSINQLNSYVSLEEYNSKIADLEKRIQALESSNTITS